MPDLPNPPDGIPPIIEATAEAGRPVNRSRWGFWRTAGASALIGFGMVLTQGAVLFIYGHALAILTDKPVPDARTLGENGFVLALSTLASMPVVVGLCLLFAWLRRDSVVDYLGLRLPPGRAILPWAGFFVLFAIASDVLTVLLGRSIIPDFMVRVMETALFPPLLWLAVVVGAPVSEEFFFRGFLFEGLRRSRLRATGAILITAALWTVIHSQYDFLQLLWIFVAGILLGLARAKTGSLLLCILLHGLMNLIATIEATVYVARHN